MTAVDDVKSRLDIVEVVSQRYHFSAPAIATKPPVLSIRKTRRLSTCSLTASLGVVSGLVPPGETFCHL